MNRTLSIHPLIAGRFPDVLVGCVSADGLGGVVSSLETVRLLQDARTAHAATGVCLERLSEDPRIAGWRQAIQACGLKPSTYRSSPEQLARRLLKGQEVNTPLPLVNLYCAVSVKHLAPLGGYDVERLPGRVIELRTGNPEHDSFDPLGASPDEMPITPPLAVYGCGEEILCWGFNHRDSKRTCLTSTTRSALFVGEAVTLAQHAPLKAALAELASLLAAGGAQVQGPMFADAQMPCLYLTSRGQGEARAFDPAARFDGEWDETVCGPP